MGFLANSSIYAGIKVGSRTSLTTGVGGVKDDAVLSVVERRDVDDTDDLLVDVRDVRLGVGHLDEPLLAVLAHHAEVVFERAQ